MSGDITDTQPLPEAAGIIPRTLCALFERLGAVESENSVKCSFIELYNEELRDLLAVDESSKLKIFDDNSRRGQTTTMVQGMEETHIKTASKGLELLRGGSHRRQVAATKCNDLSSRSHTVFTITVYMKKTSDVGEDFVSAGKLNLVDLAGSENIQRSGAENKRAAEAGLINKSLLTLGRVINALVEKSSHIPYRESKLTRLLQDSLGGRTKTCIVATLSPAKSNLEETISTLDYAFRAKNIKNKPQANQMVSKKTMLKEFTAEIEKLKSELMATRQRNGVYLTQDALDEITIESESRRILSEEQRDKIEMMETNLRNKVQELFTLNNTFCVLKKDNENAKYTLENTQSLLERTEMVLSQTKKNLGEEAYMRKAYQTNEERLLTTGGKLLQTIDRATGDMDGIRAKLRRRSDLQTTNREHWQTRKNDVVDRSNEIDQKMEALQSQQETLLASLSTRMQGFVSSELSELQQSQQFLMEKVNAFNTSRSEVNMQTSLARDELNVVVDEIKTLKEDVQVKVGSGLTDLASAAQHISADIASELETFRTQLHTSYSALGRDFKTIFEDVTRQMGEQKAEVERLQAELSTANANLVEAQNHNTTVITQALQDEQQIAAESRATLLTNIGLLIAEAANAQDQRIASHVASLNTSMETSHATHSIAQESYTKDMSSWSNASEALITQCLSSRDAVKAKIKADWSTANNVAETIKRTTETVHSQTVEIVNSQVAAMGSQLASLDDIMTKIKDQNNSHHTEHSNSLTKLESDVQESYNSIGKHMESSYIRTQDLQSDMQSRTAALTKILPALAPEGELRSMLHELRQGMQNSDIVEYVATGSTPAKQNYPHPTTLPKTESHDVLMEYMRGAVSPRLTSREHAPLQHDNSPKRSPSKHSGPIYVDNNMTAENKEEDTHDSVHTLNRSSSLRDLDPNRAVADSQAEVDLQIYTSQSTTSDSLESLQTRTSIPAPKRLKRTTTAPTPSCVPLSHLSAAESVERGKENILPPIISLGNSDDGLIKPVIAVHPVIETVVGNTVVNAGLLKPAASSTRHTFAGMASSGTLRRSGRVVGKSRGSD